MTWAGWLIALLAWLAIGMVVAYLFGLLVEGGQPREGAARPRTPSVLRLNLAARAKASFRKRPTAHSPLSADTVIRAG
ncbi:MAG: hypothetical protein IPO58_23175 [Betaproteobacteria bacterium]|nr:hypothetical protein [Betaproteobacteria bacterium]